MLLSRVMQQPGLDAHLLTFVNADSQFNLKRTSKGYAKKIHVTAIEAMQARILDREVALEVELKQVEQKLHALEGWSTTKRALLEMAFIINDFVKVFLVLGLLSAAVIVFVAKLLSQPISTIMLAPVAMAILGSFISCCAREFAEMFCCQRDDMSRKSLKESLRHIYRQRIKQIKDYRSSNVNEVSLQNRMETIKGIQQKKLTPLRLFMRLQVTHQ